MRISVVFFGAVAVMVASPVLAQGVRIDRNVRYAGTHAEQVMDVYWPARAPGAAVLFIHGGSLQESGERRASPIYRDVCRPFADAGTVCASMDYRLAPSQQWPAMPDDVVAAIVELRKRVRARGGNPDSLFLFGHSSGCHLAAIVATNPEFLRRVALSARNIAGLIPMGCTLDRDDATVRGLTPDRIRRGFSNEPQDVATYGSPENYLAANPASYVGQHVPPTLVIVAEKERFMPPLLEQGSRFVKLLLENEIRANLVVVPGTHTSSISDIVKRGDPTFAAIWRFISNPRNAATH